MKKAAILIILSVGPLATAGEAVSAVNGKVGYAGGSMEGDWGNNTFASGSVPLGSNFGLQLDGLYTDVSDRDFYGSAAHLFRRDSDKGLLGLAGGFIDQEDIDSWRAGVEGEYYLPQITLAASAGVASLEYENGPYPFIDDDVTDLFAGAAVKYYPLDDLMVSASYSYIFDNSLVQGMVEYQTPIPGLTLFAQIAGGENDYDHALFGIQLYIGPAKNLKLRHREDDPPSLMPDILDGVGAYGAEYHKRAREYVEAHPAAGGASGGSYGLGGSSGYGVEDTMSYSPMTPEEWEEWVSSQ